MTETTESPRRFVAGTARYDGDHRSMVGQVRGPLTFGGYVTATAAVYDHDHDVTTVTFSHAVEGDVTPDAAEHRLPDGPRAIVRKAGSALLRRAFAVDWRGLRF